ncbi:hypothetical protein [Maribacter spongiicola]|uniref:hypothetical protein n=1 Tax=Maribacter spongiicola TaxID=1206753 RepID=UPI003F94E608
MLNPEAFSGFCFLSFYRHHLAPPPSAITVQLQIENEKIAGLMAGEKGMVASEFEVKI